MSIFDGTDNLNVLDPATPLDGCTPYELIESVRQLKGLVKNLLLVSMLPDGRIRSDAVTTLAASSVGASQLVDLAITAEKLADGSVTAAKIADDAVTAAKLAANSVTEDAYADASIPAAAFKPNTIPVSAFADFITRALLKQSATVDEDRAVTADHIANEAVVDRTIKTMSVAKLSGGADYDMLLRIAGVWTPIAIAGALTFNSTSGLFELDNGIKAAAFGDTKARGSNGGTATAGAWNVREIGEITDPSNLTTIASNAVKLLAGKYLIYCTVPASAVGKHQARLFDLTNSAPVIWGSSEQSPATTAQTRSIICGVFEVTDPDVEYRIEHYVQNSVGSTDLGVAASSDNSTVYGTHSENYTYGFVLKIS